MLQNARSLESWCVLIFLFVFMGASWTQAAPPPSTPPTKRKKPKKEKSEAMKLVETLYVGRWIHEGQRATLDIAAGGRFSIRHPSPAGETTSQGNWKGDEKGLTLIYDGKSGHTAYYTLGRTQTQMLLMHNGQFAFYKAEKPPAPKK